MIESVDSIKIAKEIGKQSVKRVWLPMFYSRSISAARRAKQE